MVGSYQQTLIKKAMATACELLSEANIHQFLKSFNHVMTDCDGVLWHGNREIPGAAAALNKLRKLGKDVYFVTNNSTKTRGEYLEKCKALGFDANENEIFSTSFAAASYLKSLNFNRKVYVVGSKGITQELDRVNIPHLGSGEKHITALSHRSHLYSMLFPVARYTHIGILYSCIYLTSNLLTLLLTIF